MRYTKYSVNDTNKKIAGLKAYVVRMIELAYKEVGIKLEDTDINANPFHSYTFDIHSFLNGKSYVDVAYPYLSNRLIEALEKVSKSHLEYSPLRKVDDQERIETYGWRFRFFALES